MQEVINASSGKKKIFEKIIVIVCLLVPYTCSIFPALFGRYMRSGDVFIISIVLILINAFARRTFTIRLSKWFVPSILIFLIPILSMLVKGIEVQNEFLQYFTALLMAFFFSQYHDWQSFTLRIFQYLGLFYAVTVIVQILFPVPFYYLAVTLLPKNALASYSLLISNGYASGITSQASIVCCYLVMGIASIVSRIITAREYSEKIKAFDVFQLGIIIAGLLLTGKRGHLVFTTLSIFLVLYFLTNGKPDRKIKLVFGAATIICIFYVGYVSFGSKSDSQLFSSIDRLLGSESIDSVLNGRSNYYEIMKRIISTNGLFGIGWDHFRNFSINNNNGHNIYLQIVCELGAFIGIVYILLLLLVLRQAVKKLQYAHSNHNELSSRYFLNTTFVVLSLVFFTTYGLTGNPLYDTEYIAYLSIMITMFLTLDPSNYVYIERLE